MSHHHLLKRRGFTTNNVPTITVESPNGSSRTIQPNITMSPRAHELRQNILDHVEEHHETFHQQRKEALSNGDSIAVIKSLPIGASVSNRSNTPSPVRSSPHISTSPAVQRSASNTNPASRHFNIVTSIDKKSNHYGDTEYNIKDVLSTQINNLTNDDFGDTFNSFDGLSMKERRKKEMALILCVEQAQVILHRFRTLVPFVQKMEIIWAKTAPNIGRAFYTWSNEIEIEKRKEALEYVWRHKHGIDKVTNLIRNKLKISTFKKFMLWKEFAKKRSHACATIAKNVNIHYSFVKRRTIHLWFKYARSKTLQNEKIKYETKMVLQKKEMNASIHEHETNIVIDLKASQQLILKHIMKHYKRRNLSEAILIWSEHLQKIRGASTFVRLFKRRIGKWKNINFIKLKNKIKEQKIYQSLKKKALNRIIRRVRETNLQVSFRCWCSEMQRDKKSQALMLYFDLQNENKQVLKYFRKLNSNKIRRKIKREFGRRKKKKIEISVFFG